MERYTPGLANTNQRIGATSFSEPLNKNLRIL
jgi:hypothetical protein